MPALFTSTEGISCSASTRSRTASSDPRSTTSPASSAAQPRGASAPSARTSIPTTVAPASASAAIQTGPSFPSAPVTTATTPASGLSALNALAALGELLLRHRLVQQFERQRGVGPHRMTERAPDEAVELIRREAVARRFRRDVRLAQRVPCREIGSRDELLRHLQRGLRLAGVHALRAVAEGDLDPAQVADELAQALRLERE